KVPGAALPRGRAVVLRLRPARRAVEVRSNPPLAARPDRSTLTGWDISAIASEIFSEQPTHQAGSEQQQSLPGSHQYIAQGTQNNGCPDFLEADETPRQNPPSQSVVKQKPRPVIDGNVQEVEQRAGEKNGPAIPKPGRESGNCQAAVNKLLKDRCNDDPN